MDVYYLHFATIDSTNSWAKEHAHELDGRALTCITSDVQTAGRGRMGRQWVSKKGNLHMSLFFCLPFTDPRLPNLAQLLTYATAQVMHKYNIAVQIKWPNDLVVEGKKLCGILVETVPVGVVLGIGVNVNTPVEADQPTTYMAAYTHKPLDLIEVRDQIIAYFQKALERSFKSLVPYFNQLLAFKNERVRCTCDGKVVEGILLGVDEYGHLKVQVGKEVVSLSSGDIHKQLQE